MTLFASAYILPEQLYPWLGIASGVMVVVIGLAVMRTRFSPLALHARRGSRATGTTTTTRTTTPTPTTTRTPRPRSLARHGHTHHPPDEPLTMRGLLALGVSGGLVPCPSALVVLIAAISQHRVGLGMALILAFSVGLAATLTAVGLSVLYGGRLIERLRPERRLFGGRLMGALPALSATPDRARRDADHARARSPSSADARQAAKRRRVATDLRFAMQSTIPHATRCAGGVKESPLMTVADHSPP